MQLTRRRILKLGASAGGAFLMSTQGPVSRAFASDPRSPFTEPFVDDLPVPPTAQPVQSFLSPRWSEFTQGATYYHIVVERRTIKFHRDLRETEIWGYRDVNTAATPDLILGPTFKRTFLRPPGTGRLQGGTLVRFSGAGNLPGPDDPLPFGEARFTTHLHGAHVPSRSDGYPTDPLPFDGRDHNVRFFRGAYTDYYYPFADVGFTSEIAPTERCSTLWYHDHDLDFTGPNVYRGLAGFCLLFEDPATDIFDHTGKRLAALDTGNENADPPALGLPSGNFDIPLVLQDKIFAPDGSVVFDPLEHDGFLGDKMLVNGKVQPKLRVQRHKYRFRFLNGSNARFYYVSLMNSGGTQTLPMTMIATEGGLMAQSVPVTGFLLGMAERREVVVDFKDFPHGTELFFVNRLAQQDGRGPDGTYEAPELVSPGTRLLKLVVDGGPVQDNSRCPAVLRPFAPISQAEAGSAKIRTFVFERRHGLWVINGELAGHIEAPLDPPSPLNRPEIWRFINKSGGWWHPIHVHSEYGRALRRKGWSQPPFFERDGIAKKDTFILGPDSEVDVFFKFRDFRGPFVFHCHNIEHEDHAMMARFDVAVGDRGETGSTA